MRSRPRATFADRIKLPPPGGVITRIVPSTHDPSLISLRIGRAGTPLLSAEAARRLGAREGADWTPELRDAILAALVTIQARDYALNAAARRPLSKRQLETKLLQRAIPLPDARAIADELAARGVIDEPALARHLADGQLLRKAAGKTMLVAKLRSRGIDHRIAETAADAAIADSGIDPRDAAIELARKKARTLPRTLEPRAAQRRLYAYLARRGFDPETCAAATREALTARNPSG